MTTPIPRPCCRPLLLFVLVLALICHAHAMRGALRSSLAAAKRHAAPTASSSSKAAPAAPVIRLYHPSCGGDKPPPSSDEEALEKKSRGKFPPREKNYSDLPPWAVHFFAERDRQRSGYAAMPKGGAEWLEEKVAFGRDRLELVKDQAGEQDWLTVTIPLGTPIFRAVEESSSRVGANKGGGAGCKTKDSNQSGEAKPGTGQCVTVRTKGPGRFFALHKNVATNYAATKNRDGAVSPMIQQYVPLTVESSDSANPARLLVMGPGSGRNMLQMARAMAKADEEDGAKPGWPGNLPAGVKPSAAQMYCQAFLGNHIRYGESADPEGGAEQRAKHLGDLEGNVFEYCDTLVPPVNLALRNSDYEGDGYVCGEMDKELKRLGFSGWIAMDYPVGALKEEDMHPPKDRSASERIVHSPKIGSWERGAIPFLGKHHSKFHAEMYLSGHDEVLELCDEQPLPEWARKGDGGKR